jgi:hypothetical protein
MTKLQTKFRAGYTLTAVLLIGAVILGISQIPGKIEFKQSTVSAETVDSSTIASIVYGPEASSSEAQAEIAKQKDFVSSRGAYDASLAVVEKNADAIKSTAAEKGVPEDVAIGVAFLENGGSETAKSPAGALGIYQLMPATARNLGLTVTKSVDERKDVDKSIEAGVTYLASNYENLGDWGLATWAYHAGVGNVSKALKIYAKANDGIELKGISDFPELKAYVVSHGITVDKLLSDPSVQKFTEKLSDDSSGYPYKVAATATLFREAQADNS